MYYQYNLDPLLDLKLATLKYKYFQVNNLFLHLPSLKIQQDICSCDTFTCRNSDLVQVFCTSLCGPVLLGPTVIKPIF